MFIKFTVVYLVVYLVVSYITRLYLNSLNPMEKLVYSIQMPPKLQNWMAALGAMKLLAIIFSAISVIMLVVKYL